jgi:hypothetical protein
LCHYVVWSPVVRVHHCISGAVWTQAPSLTLSLSCTAMSPIPSSYSVSSTVIYRSLPVFLLSLTCSCTIYTATSVLQTVSVVHASYFINISQYQMWSEFIFITWTFHLEPTFWDHTQIVIVDQNYVFLNIAGVTYHENHTCCTESLLAYTSVTSFPWTHTSIQTVLKFWVSGHYLYS